jgi:hypothetical protein
VLFFAIVGFGGVLSYSDMSTDLHGCARILLLGK